VTITAQAAQLQSRLRSDTPFWARHCCKILTPGRQLVPLIANDAQLRFDTQLEAQRAAGLPMRAIVLKSRKRGFSTWVVAKSMQRCTTWAHQHAILVAQDLKTAGELHGMAERMYYHLPFEHELGMGFNIRPDLTGANFSPQGRKYLSFGERTKRLRQRSIDSIYEVDTANTPTAGRGYTPSIVHGSEVAHWPENGKLLGLLNAVAYELETIVILESTANGFNHFQKRWQRAVEGLEDPEVGGSYLAIFEGWTDDPACWARWVDTPEAQHARQRFIDSIGTGPYGEREPDLMERFGCTPEQLLWRRRTIRENCDDSIEQFDQEYPATAEDAFIGSGNGVFSGILVSRAIYAAEKAMEPAAGWLRGTDWHTKTTRGGTVNIPGGAEWVPWAQAGQLPDDVRPRSAPALFVYEHPINDRTQEGIPEDERRETGCYVVTVDVAGDPIANGPEGDAHAIQVIDHISKQQVAVWSGRIDHADLRLLALLVALYYNEAFLAVEVTGGIGLPVAVPLQTDYRYRFMHRRRVADDRRQQETQKVGWDTNRATKPLIEGAMLDAFKDGTHGIRHMATALEFNTYVVHENGDHGAREGNHDDLAVSWMIAQYLAVQLRPRRRDRKKTGRLSGFDGWG
jgi:hypothetical protein